ncbi:glycolate oxidase subunit GlcE [Aquamicrobium zhengzhouense]|uniref:Glycolate oxidase subunit GlcE n=1 Tax=Aquamicrobium zhengzhouense TaxID=2781738 RepID=A0ABS0SEB5_9HYPH|nr:glycolate oxidase subunit GlcE [Aquamicrobium zhengzhouense]MBI1621129.1 glycolate oxidase subunit GlcE [Aquamicrobium zhengzhouense]
MTSFTPTTPEEALEAVRWAAAEETPVEIVGHGSKRAIGHLAPTEHEINLSKLTGVTLYEPEELVLSARAGTPVQEIEALLVSHNQELQFEPIDYGPLLGGPEGRGTIGGVLASNLAGPRRLKVGAARDHILGIHAVSGRGEAFKSGGRVVKNVTGYDLSKAMAGSWGTLAVLTDVTFKVMPRPETETTLVLRGLTEEQAAEAMSIAMGSSGEVASAAHLPESVTGRVLDGALRGRGSTLLRLEGFGPSADYRFERLAALLDGKAVQERVDGDQSRALWREIRDCRPYADGSQRPIWRVSMPPSKGHRMVMALRMEAAVDAFYDWQGGLIWLRMEGDPEVEAVRRLVAQYGGGHATLVRAHPSVRASAQIFQPQSPALTALSVRLKDQFDPKGILNPGRMGF